jgi:CBS domain containing-hemolysin-like protein
VTLLVVYAVLAVGVSFLCSLLEACLLSVPAGYVRSLADRRVPFSLVLLRMKEGIDRPLAAILTLNTVSHTVGAAGVGAQAAVVFGSAAVGLASAVMTVLILVVSEIIPKTLGAVHAKRLAIPAALVIRVMIWVSLPAIVPLEWVNRLVGSGREREVLGRGELLATIRMGRAAGVLRRSEFAIGENLLRFSVVRLSEVLTPRTVVFALSASSTVGEVMSEHYPLRFARMPVLGEGWEDVKGYVSRYGIERAHARGREGVRLGELAERMPVLPEQGTARRAMETLLAERKQIALVVDEHGATAGIVTMEDLVETLLGDEIVDETDSVADMQALARRRAGSGGAGG